MHRIALLALAPLFALAAACGGAPTPPPSTAATSAADVKGSVDAELRQSLAGAQRTEKERARDTTATRSRRSSSSG